MKFKIAILLCCMIIGSIDIETVAQENYQPVQGFSYGTSLDIVLYERQQELEGYFFGIAGANIIGNDTTAEKGFIKPYVNHIQEVADLLALDVRRYLNESSSRSDALSIYQQELEKEYQKVTLRLAAINQQINIFGQEYNTNERERVRLEQQVLNAIDDKNGNLAEVQLQQFLLVQEKAETASSRQKVMQRIRAKYQLAANLLNEKRRFMAANREAIIKGVVVVNIPDDQIKLIFTEREWEQ